VDNPSEVASSIFENAVSLAGLLLVFMGFVYSRGESMSNTRRGDKYKQVARFGLIPFAILLLSAWLGLNCMEGDVEAYRASAIAFRFGLSATGLFGIYVFFVYL
jgi:hypothetical protein